MLTSWNTTLFMQPQGPNLNREDVVLHWNTSHFRVKRLSNPDLGVDPSLVENGFNDFQQSLDWP